MEAIAACMFYPADHIFSVSGYDPSRESTPIDEHPKAFDFRDPHRFYSPNGVECNRVHYYNYRWHARFSCPNARSGFVERGAWRIVPCRGASPVDAWIPICSGHAHYLESPHSTFHESARIRRARRSAAKSYTVRRVLTCRTGCGRRRSACSPHRSRCRPVNCHSARSKPQGCLSIHRMTRLGLVTYW